MVGEQSNVQQEFGLLICPIHYYINSLFMFVSIFVLYYILYTHYKVGWLVWVGWLVGWFFFVAQAHNMPQQQIFTIYRPWDFSRAQVVAGVVGGL